MAELSGWITTDVAVTLTGYSAAHIRRLAREGRIGTRRVGRDWLVSREDLLAHKARMDALGTDKHNPWRDDLGDGGRR
jgi:excisionase family DNA binding protein